MKNRKRESQLATGRPLSKQVDLYSARVATVQMVFVRWFYDVVETGECATNTTPVEGWKLLCIGVYQAITHRCLTLGVTIYVKKLCML